MSEFRTGGYNTLVSTCVGEEGLDIGDVDLIICFDAHKSPIRLVQRMGRTGRKHQGRIVMLVTQGKEEQVHKYGLIEDLTYRQPVCLIIFCPIKGGKLPNVITHNLILVNQMTDSILYCWQCTHECLRCICFPAFA